MTSEMTSELDTSQFNNTPIIRKVIRKVIRKLKSRSQPNVVEETKFHDEQEEEEQQQEEEEVKPKSNRGRKRKYHTAEERLAARRLQQKAYRERKKAELAALKGNSEQAESEYSQ